MKDEAKRPMNACIDIGNSRVKLAFFVGREPKELQIFSHEENQQIQECLERNAPDRSILSSTADESFSIDLGQAGNVLYLKHDTPLPIEVEYEGKTLGLDRMADAVGAWALDAPATMAIDMGTCITYNVVEGNRFVGGSISPGLRMRLQAMHTFTGRLPLIEELNDVPRITKNTTDALVSGAHYGVLAELEAHLSSFYTQFPEGKCALTGGDSPRFAHSLKNPIFVDPLLTLRGLNEILLHYAD